jgi:ubiquinone/menaquinone biosynthesis C-methylase UbiE
MLAAMLRRLARKLRGAALAGGVGGQPEDYWIGRGENVIGRATLEQFQNGRQVDTYRQIHEALAARTAHELADLGCNVAALGQLLYSWGFEGDYVGYDSNPHALDVARRELEAVGRPSKLVEGNIRALPFADREFEFVVLKDVLEHMESFEPLLREAARVADRYLVVSTFLVWTDGSPIVRREQLGYFHNLYRREDVYAFAAELGFTVDEVRSAYEFVGEEPRPNEVVVFARAPSPQA